MRDIDLGGPGQITLLTDRRRESLLALAHETWSPEALGTVWKTFGWPAQAPQELTLRMARGRFPGLRLPFSYAHTGWLFLISFAGVVTYVGAWVAFIIPLT